VLACLIDRASNTKGACYPSQEFIAGWTFRPKRTVERAIASLDAKKLIRVRYRGTHSNAYIINWEPIFAAYHALVAFERRNKERHGDASVAPAAKSGGSIPISSPEVAGLSSPEVADKPWNRNHGSYLNHGPIRETSDEVSYLVDIKKVEEGIQGEQVEGTEFQHASSAEPIIPEPDLVEVVEEALSRHPLYVELLGWSGLGLELMMDAATAERDEAGAGVVLVVERFVAAQKEVGT
jgi:hypothetical protein